MNSIIQLLANAPKDNIYLLGSSKGGVGALLLGLRFGYPNIIVNAPQARLADYIKIRSLDILSYMLDCPKDLKELYYKQLNDYLLNSINRINYQINWNIHITCGSEDAYHLKELDLIYEFFVRNNISITKQLVRGGHDNQSIEDYRMYFRQIILG